MRAEQLQGHLDALLLGVLEPGPLHGYAIIETLSARSDGAFDLPTGTVYPALRRIEQGDAAAAGKCAVERCDKEAHVRLKDGLEWVAYRHCWNMRWRSLLR